MGTDRDKLAKAAETLKGQGQQDAPRTSADLAISDPPTPVGTPPRETAADETRRQPGSKTS
ncbi:hypothetical protein [Aureimonas leprariae]|uniref:Uncharacterized protein n=1 Tax=Plantimonas leprariae TaxID=2615207 RepID=A0A7V7TYE4_9HYPH|nr:hypothetical protein [Aureimonas leprariae]KAB0677172.1 hypothetical protein F6X38_18775 [Aureimonas leprariae]